MNGKMSFVYVPVGNLKSALAFYRDQLGLDEAWREGDRTVVFKLPGTEVELMLDLVEEGGTTGPAFILPSVDVFYAARRETLAFVGTPTDIRPGRAAAVRDPSGNMLYFFDMSKAGEENSK